MIRNIAIGALCLFGQMSIAANASISETSVRAPSVTQTAAANGAPHLAVIAAETRNRERRALGVLRAAGFTDVGDIRVVDRDTIVNARTRGRVYKVVVTRWGVVEVL
jgi:hypothetical protein